MELWVMACAVKTREDFVRFLQALNVDLRANGSEWENPTLPDFLDGLYAWTESLDGFFANRNEPIPTDPSWSLVAQMLVAARGYE